MRPVALLALFAVGVALVAASVAGASGRGVAAPPIRLAVPTPGHVTLSAVLIRVGGKRVLRLPNRLGFRLASSRALPKTARLLMAVVSKRGKGFITYGMFFALVNLQLPGERALAARRDELPGLPPPIDPAALKSYVSNWNNDVVFPAIGISSGSGPGTAMVFTLTGNDHFPSVAVTKVTDSSAPTSIPFVLAGQDQFDAFDMDLGTAAQRGKFDSALTVGTRAAFGTTPSGLQSLPNLTIGLYDDAHPKGFQFDVPTTNQVFHDAWSLPSAPQQSLEEIVQKIEAELLAGGSKTPPPPPPPPKQQLFTYAFSGLQLSFDGPNVPNIGRRHVDLTLLGGGCGTALRADWKGTFQVSALGPPSAAWSTPLTSGTSAPIYTWSFTDSTSGATGQVQMNLIFLAGSPPKVGIRWTSTGDIANVAVTPDVAPTVTPVTSC